MFGTIVKIRPLPGKEEAILELTKSWDKEVGPTVEGYLTEYFLRLKDHPGEFMGIVLFDSEENYQKNASNPNQNQWYSKFRALLETDPEWNDGSVIFTPEREKTTL